MTEHARPRPRLMTCSSTSLAEAAFRLRTTIGEDTPAMLRNGVRANARQLTAAAWTIAGSTPSRLTAPIPTEPLERPGYIDAEGHPTDGTLRVTIGILGATYSFAPDGERTEVPR